MTDLHLDDEQLSALVDGMGSPDESTHAASCPSCATRLAAWREVVGGVSALGEHPLSQAPDSRRDEMIGAVIRAAGTRRRRLGPWLAAAAVIVVVAGLAAGLTQFGGSHLSSHRNASSASVASPPATSPSSGAGAASSPAAAGPGFDLGEIDNPSGLVAALQSASGSQATIGFGCLAIARSDAGVGADAVPSKVAQLGYQGVPAQAFVFPAEGRHVVVVIRTPGCAMLVRSTY